MAHASTAPLSEESDFLFVLGWQTYPPLTPPPPFWPMGPLALGPMLAHRAQVDAATQVGQTPLHVSCLLRGTEAACQGAKALLDAGANVDSPKYFGSTPLMQQIGIIGIIGII